MAWTKLDDRFWSHPKIQSLSPTAFRLYVMALNWSVSHLTDGKVPEPVVTMFCDRYRRRSVAELLSCGLWEQGLDAHYLIHDFGEYQPSKVQVVHERTLTRQRVQAHRDRKQAESEPSMSRSGNGVTNGVVTLPRPDPTRKTTPKGVAKPSKSDPVFDAVYEATTGRKWEPGTKVTAAARGRMNTAAKQLRDIGATPGQVTAAATRYRDEWPDMELTPMALVTNWDRFTGEVTARCNHRWSDGRTAWSLTTRGGTDLTRCDKCGEVK